MMTLFRQLCRVTDRHTGAFLLVGLVGLGAYNWRLWRRDHAFAARLRAEHAPAPSLPRTPKVSVLVAAWNEQKHIDAHIRSFLALEYPNIELIVCAGGQDETLTIAQRFAGPKVIVLEQQPGEGKQRALARCLAHAGGDIMYLTDADCLFDEDALTRILAPLINENEQAATGASRPFDAQLVKALPAYLWAADAVSNAHAPAYSEGLLGRNTALTHAAIEQIGGLDFVARTGTDYQLAKRLVGAGVAIRHVSASVVPSEYPETLGAYRRKQSRWLRNLLLHGRQHRAWGDVYVTIKTVMTGALMLLAPFVTPVLGRGVLALWSLLVAHATVAKLRYVLFTARLSGRPATVRLLMSLAPLTLIDFAVWTLPLFDLLHPRRREQW